MPEIYSPKVFAHRGSNTLAPENSKPAFELALIEGADGFETDIQLSKDLTPLLFHDDEMERIGMPSKSIDQFYREELELLDISMLSKEFHRFCGLLSLEDFLKSYYKKTSLLLEIKEFKNSKPKELETQIRQILNQLLAASVNPLKVMISSFDFPILKMLNELSSKNFIVANIEEEKYTKDLQGLMKELPFIKGICLLNSLVNADVTAQAKSLGLKTLTYTCNTEEEIRPVVESRVDIIISDLPGKCRKIVDKILNKQ